MTCPYFLIPKMQISLTNDFIGLTPIKGCKKATIRPKAHCISQTAKVTKAQFARPAAITDVCTRQKSGYNLLCIIF
jgi:hypothetical protein